MRGGRYSRIILSGPRSSTYFPSRLLPASATSSTLRQKRMPWSSPTIFLPSPTWGMSERKIRDGSGNHSRHRNRDGPGRAELRTCLSGQEDDTTVARLAVATYGHACEG